MREYIALDRHKHYTWAEREEVATGRVVQGRVPHAPGALRRYREPCEPGTAVAVEATEATNALIASGRYLSV